ncbi:hypothetical protein HK096_004382 [Nowakowskiella sp. JEL0078]|nr:hypothetical protein HK096_004382 [Nowakowskiella sp. JEL0078]
MRELVKYYGRDASSVFPKFPATVNQSFEGMFPGLSHDYQDIINLTALSRWQSSWNQNDGNNKCKTPRFWNESSQKESFVTCRTSQTDLIELQKCSFTDLRIDRKSFDNSISSGRSLITIQDNVLDISTYLQFSLDNSSIFLPRDVDRMLRHNIGKDATLSLTEVRNRYVGLMENPIFGQCDQLNLLLYTTYGVFAIFILTKILSSLIFWVVSKFFPRVGIINDLPPTDKKLFIVVCDGRAMSANAHKDSAGMVLDILGYSDLSNEENSNSSNFISFENNSKERNSNIVGSFDYLSVGVGKKRLNSAQIYSGFEKRTGTPYLVIIKRGNPSESIRPGNRGKRDSIQMISSAFSKIFRSSQSEFDSVYKSQEIQDPILSFFELQIYKHVQKVLCLDMRSFQFFCIVDSDTIVDENSIAKMASHLRVHPATISVHGNAFPLIEEPSNIWKDNMKFCYDFGYTLSDQIDFSFGATSHGTGCFVMYRLSNPVLQTFTPVSGNPSAYNQENLRNCITHPSILNDMHVIPKTLQNRQVMFLSEEKYVELSLQKHFPNAYVTYLSSATCFTVLPHDFRAYLANRRRIINSNFFIILERLCLPVFATNDLQTSSIKHIFRRFRIKILSLISLLAYFIIPAITAHFFICLLYDTFYLLLVNKSPSKPHIVIYTTVAIMCAIQALSLLLRRKYRELIGFVFYYLPASLFFGLIYPFYCFWHIDKVLWSESVEIDGNLGNVRSWYRMHGAEESKDIVRVSEKRQREIKRILKGEIEKKKWWEKRKNSLIEEEEIFQAVYGMTLADFGKTK